MGDFNHESMHKGHGMHAAPKDEAEPSAVRSFIAGALLLLFILNVLYVIYALFSLCCWYFSSEKSSESDDVESTSVLVVTATPSTSCELSEPLLAKEASEGESEDMV